ncbi:MAG TPA: methyltransferase domain-containing protein [Mycobacterium sp.]|nr:methyltransferase domain-containing protein [Mycobacterium sp.]
MANSTDTPALAPPSPIERQRISRDHLDTLAALFNESTFRRVASLGIGPGWNCWEAAAGSASVPSWLAQRVGLAGHVLASDIDTHALEAVPDPPFEVRRHDLTVDPPRGADFDFVHARLVLEHLSDPSAALMTLVSALRPCGWLLVESADPKLQPLACPDEVGPRQALANKLRSAVWELMAQRSDLSLGRTLPRLFRDAGLVEVDAEVSFSLAGPAARRMQHTLITVVRPALAAAGAATEHEIDQHLADLGSADLDIAVFPVVAAWGRRKEMA